MSRVFRNCWSRMQRLRKWGGNTPRLSGSFRLDPRTLRPERLKWLNNPSGKLRKPCDLGLCKSKPEAKIAASSLQKASNRRLAPKIANGARGCPALSRSPNFQSLCTYRLEAAAGTYPPPAFLLEPRARLERFPVWWNRRDSLWLWDVIQGAV